MWTLTTRLEHSRDHLRYESDLTVAEWEIIAPFLPPPAKKGRPRRWSISGARQLHRCAVASVVALQAQGQATQGRDLSTLAPLRALRARTSDPAWARRVVGEGVKSCPRAGCGSSACPVR
jgi:hypothetical protein